MTPRVSVIIPAFNREKTIRRAVESVQRQHFVDLEILVVDDASNDATRAVVSVIEEPRLRLIARAQNGGASAARNSGIIAARGDLIAFLDSDDEWMPAKLGRQIDALQSAPSGDCVSCTGFIIHLLDHGTTRIQRLEPTVDWARRLAMDCNLGPGTTQLATRQIFERIGLLDETLPRFEDWDWLIRYTRQHGIVPVPEPLAHVYNRRARLGRVVEESAAIFCSKHEMTWAALSPDDRRQAVCDMWLQSVGTYAFEGKFFAALAPALKAARQRPFHTLNRLWSSRELILHLKNISQG
jgi:glycosyltransferase involved in cell wall biosynthesis